MVMTDVDFITLMFLIGFIKGIVRRFDSSIDRSIDREIYIERIMMILM